MEESQIPEDQQCRSSGTHGTSQRSEIEHRSLKSNKISNAKMTTLQKHLSGQCHPCVAFAIRPSGCYKGDTCTHCHFCTAEEAKERRRRIQVEAKERKRQAKIDAAMGMTGTDSRFWI